MSYLGQDFETEEEALVRQQRALEVVQQASGELKAAAPEVLKNIGVGSLLVMIGIYWLLIKR